MEIFFIKEIIQIKIIPCKKELHFKEEKKPDHILLHPISKIRAFKIIFDHWLFGCLMPVIFPVSILSVSFFIQIYPIVHAKCRTG